MGEERGVGEGIGRGGKEGGAASDSDLLEGHIHN